jgi:hypothetical protein
MIDRTFAQRFATEWVESWNSHDLERVLAHYTEEFEMSSPFIFEWMGEPSARLKGKDKIRPYWAKGLSASPPLKFELERVFVGVDSITVEYQRIGTGSKAAEVLFFDSALKVIRGVAHY